MPNRIICESIARSEKLAKLTDFEFRLWVTLITLVDDYGCGDARPAIIKGSGFPFRKRLTEEDIARGLVKLAAVGCIVLYEIDGRPYLQFPNWLAYQRIRKSKHRFPEPPANMIGQLPVLDAACGNSPQLAATCGSLRPESESESETESKEDEEDARAPVDEIDMNSPWYRFVREYHQNIGDFPASAYEIELLQSNFEILGPEVMSEAIRVTALKHASNPHRFMQSVCADWIEKDVHTIERARAVTMDHERQQKGGAYAVNRRGADEQPRRVGCETIL